MDKNLSGSLRGAIDEMLEGLIDGNIKFSSSGSKITITPTLESGTKIADITLDDISIELFAPTPIKYEAGDNVIIEDDVISVPEHIQYLRPTNGVNVISNYFSETRKYYQQIRSTSGYEGYTYAINYDFELGANYRIEFDYKNSIGRFNTNYPWRFYVSEWQVSNFDVETGTPNLPKDDVYHHLSYDFTASTKFLYLVFAMASVSEGGLNEVQNVTITKIS